MRCQNEQPIYFHDPIFFSSCDGTAEGMPVMYGQPFYIQDIKEGVNIPEA